MRILPSRITIVCHTKTGKIDLALVTATAGNYCAGAGMGPNAGVNAGAGTTTGAGA